jgi:hypothetical protein
VLTKKLYDFDTKLLIFTKKKYNDEKVNESEKVEIYEPLTNNQKVDRNAEEIVLLTRQAIELYRASKWCLFMRDQSCFIIPIQDWRECYSLVPLNPPRYSEDMDYLTMVKNQSYVRETVRFHDSYNPDPSIYILPFS